MTKFHINKHGVPAPCKATKGNCPLGGDEQHFSNKEEAQVAADEINAAKYGHLPEVTDDYEKILDEQIKALKKQIEEHRDIFERLKGK